MPSDAFSRAERSRPATWIGLFIALFGLFVIRQAVRIVSNDPGTALVIVRELLIFASAGGLPVVVKWGRNFHSGRSVWGPRYGGNRPYGD
jgi:hypothetical protein